MKFFVSHDEGDSYVTADECSLTPGGDLCFVSSNKLTASFAREQWSFCKQIIEEDEE